MSQPALQEINRALTQILPGGIAGFRVKERDLLFFSPGLAALAGYAPGDPVLERDSWYYDLICPEDRAWIGKEAVRQLAKQGRAEIVYRLIKPSGDILWVKQYSGVVEHGALGPYFLCLVVDYSETWRARAEASQTEYQMNSIINAIPGGVARLDPHAGFRVLLASDGFYRLTGYGREEYQRPPIGGEAIAQVLPEDRAGITRALEILMEEGRPMRAEYRIRRKDGTVAWNTAYCSRTDQMDGRPVLDAVFLDTTETKRLEQAGRINAERYRIVSEQSQDIIFDWDLETDLIYHSAALEQKLGFHQPERLKVSELFSAEIYAQEDRVVVEEAARRVREGTPYLETEYRLRRSDGAMIWFRARVTTLFDDEGQPIRAIGVLTDIDSYKRETARFQEKAERDLLTGLLNRVTFEEKLREMARHMRPGGSLHAFFLIDVDNFKEINDLLGHAAGDRALVMVAKAIQSCFREGDLVARMGGDEFAAVIGELPDRKAAEARADRLVQALRLQVEGQSIASSLGVALCPDHGCAFDIIYRHADVALYTAKRCGRDRWAMYEPTK